MRDLKDKTAFITGAASGIGLGMARMFAAEGVNIAVADIQADKVDAACREVAAFGVKAHGIVLDVADKAAMESAADQAQAALGPVHLLCNNAGVAISGTTVEQVKPAEWDWLIAVNLYGVINGVTTFLPRMQAHGAQAHIINTASVGGLYVRKGLTIGAYAATKFGVVGLTEALRNELEGSPIGVSVLCPAQVRTNINDTPQLRQARFGGPFRPPVSAVASKITGSEGMPPDDVGKRVIAAIRNGDFYIFSHTQVLRAALEAKYKEMIQALDNAERFGVAS